MDEISYESSFVFLPPVLLDSGCPTTNHDKAVHLKGLDGLRTFDVFVRWGFES